MKMHLYGGFSEKGRTSVGVECQGVNLILDVGINTSDPESAYYPAIRPDVLARADAILVTHAHEDHIGGLGWCVANGFHGRIFMTRETRGDMDACLAEYATPEDRARAAQLKIEFFEPGGALQFGPVRIETGRSGHAVGGVWFRAVEKEGPTVLYCGDVVPHSPVLAMDPPPPSDVLLFDASYGEDVVPLSERIRDIRRWVAEADGACLLPTPLIGRSLELIAALEQPVAIHHCMRSSLAQQMSQQAWLQPGASELLLSRLSNALDWRENEPFPAMPLLTDDGMGIAGPSRAALARALDEGVPILLTGHLPSGSPAEAALKQRRADWIRLPTHPTWPETMALIQRCRPQISIAHSCDRATLNRLVAKASGLRLASTGEVLDLRGLVHAHSDL